jgi:hypothetical protein
MFRLSSDADFKRKMPAMLTTRPTRVTHFARVLFPRTIFCGPYDERSGKDGNQAKTLFIGKALANIHASPSTNERL